MRRITAALVALVVGVTVALVASSPAQAASPNDCMTTKYYPGTSEQIVPFSTIYLPWSVTYQYYYTTGNSNGHLNAGNCGNAWVTFHWFYGAPTGSQRMKFKIRTYFEGTDNINFDGPWSACLQTGEFRDVRGEGRLSTGRDFRIYAKPCSVYNGSDFFPSFRINAGNQV